MRVLIQNNFSLLISVKYFKRAKSDSTAVVEGLKRIMLSKRPLILSKLLLLSDHHLKVSFFICMNVIFTSGIPHLNLFHS